MFKKWISFFLILCSSLVSSCSLPRQKATTNPDLIATQVQRMLTNVPTARLLTSIPATRIVSSTTPEAPESSSVPPTSAASQTPISPSPTASATDPKLTLGDPTWKDTLDTGKNFYLYEDSHVKFESKSGYLALVALNPDNWYAWTLSITKLTNFYMEATMKPEDCSGTDRYGLMIHAGDQNEGYMYGLTCDGQYGFRKWDGSHFTDLVKWTQDPAIHKGPNQINRLGIMANAGGHYALYVNGNLLKQVDDMTYSQGTFGFFVSSSKTSNFTVQADEIAYWTIQ